METRWHVAQGEADWLRQAVAYIQAAEARALRERGEFHIVLAGGGTPRKVYEQLAKERHDWAHWQIWFGDERCLPPADDERNVRMAMAAWLAQVSIPVRNIHAIPAEHGAVAASESYNRALAAVGSFDLVLLGLGEDGHTASLFPGQDWGEAIDAPDVLAVYDAPKPPPERVSLSARRLSQAEAVLFLVTGPAKREAVKAWRGGVTLPAAAIRPACGVDVLLDADSALP